MINISIADNHRLACEVKLISTSQANQWSVHGKDYDSAINVHVCRNPGGGGGGGYLTHV